MNNTTVLTSTGLELTNNYDSIGAMIFIIVVIFWYALGGILLMVMQTIKPTEIVEDSDRHSKRLFKKNFHEKSNDKIILEELVDKDKRDKLWDIYFGESGELNDRATQADRLRIQHIERTLANMKEKNRDNQRSVRFMSDNRSLHSNLSSSAPNLLSMDGRLRVRRQLSRDQQLLEQWQAIMGDFRVNENWPWAIQRLFIQRHLRRQRR